MYSLFIKDSRGLGQLILGKEVAERDLVLITDLSCKDTLRAERPWLANHFFTDNDTMKFEWKVDLLASISR